MGKMVEIALVQGTVTFTVNCNDLMGLVPLEYANNEDILKQWLESKARRMLDFAETEVEIDGCDTVKISEETAERFTGTLLGPNEWKDIMTENRNSK